MRAGGEGSGWGQGDRGAAGWPCDADSGKGMGWTGKGEGRLDTHGGGAVVSAGGEGGGWGWLWEQQVGRRGGQAVRAGGEGSRRGGRQRKTAGRLIMQQSTGEQECSHVRPYLHEWGPPLDVRQSLGFPNPVSNPTRPRPCLVVPPNPCTIPYPYLGPYSDRSCTIGCTTPRPGMTSFPLEPPSAWSRGCGRAPTSTPPRWCGHVSRTQCATVFGTAGGRGRGQGVGGRSAARVKV